MSSSTSLPSSPIAASNLPRSRRNLCVALLVMLGFSLGCSEFAVIGIETELAQSFGVTLQTAGFTMSSFAVTYAVCTPLLAVCTGRFRRFQLLVAYAVVFCLGNVVAAIAPTFPVLIASRVVIGAVSGAYLAVGVTFLPELLGRGNTSMAISVVYGAFSVAMVIVTSVGKLVADALDWHLVMVGTLVLAVAVSAALVLVLPRQGATDTPATACEQLALLQEPQVLSGICIFVFGVGAVYVFYGYVTPYLEEVFGLTGVQASMVLMGYGFACMVSNLLSGWFDARFGLKSLVPTFLAQALILFSLFLVGGRTAPGLALVFGIALSMYVVSVPCISMFMKASYDAHPKALTLASSLEPMAFNIGIAFGSAVGGAVVAGPGIANAGMVGSAFSLVACCFVLLSIALERRARRRNHPQAVQSR